ncbi:YaeF family permuted papain-like enzyme [Niveibacterium sp.]|uniref:YaeF family permuted papain-like enzyme n=1 Tax=Niveibacterium sp. TaxID=2017444 RepID=UPI0035B35918
MIHRILLLCLLLCCSACATQVAEKPLDALAPGGQPPIAFQRTALSPHNGGTLIGEQLLRAGDILLSAANGITSAGIRLFTLAPVSHAALYIGNGEVAEAVGEGVRVRSVAEVLDEESVVVAFRHPTLDDAAAARIRSFAQEKVGDRYNYVGVMMQAPFSIERRLCELPTVPATIRDACINGLATVQLGNGTAGDDRFFCSQFVLEAYREAGHPITKSNPTWVSPADILHMREGDVSSIQVDQPLTYVGHLKFPPAPAPVVRVPDGA